MCATPSGSGAACSTRLSEPFDLADQEISIGASIGIALRPEHGTTLHDLMRAADAAMYHAKAHGPRPRRAFHRESSPPRSPTAPSSESDLREAVDKDQFTLVFQPQVSARRAHRGGRGAAALARIRTGCKLPAQLHPARRGDRADRRDRRMGGRRASPRRSRAGAAWASSSGSRSTSARASSTMPASSAGCARRCWRPTRRRSLLELEITETLAMHCSSEVLEAIAPAAR